LNTEPFPAENVAVTAGIPSGTEGRCVFILYCKHKLKKGKKFKTLRQNNAVLRRAALSGPRPAPDRAC